MYVFSNKMCDFEPGAWSKQFALINQRCASHWGYRRLELFEVDERDRRARRIKWRISASWRLELNDDCCVGVPPRREVNAQR